jgi:hypothetical protein
MCRWLHKLLFSSRSNRLVETVQRLDCQNREVRHDLKNIAARADALQVLFSKMRDDETWVRPRREDPH